VRLTGLVPIEDEEFATLTEGLVPNTRRSSPPFNSRLRKCPRKRQFLLAPAGAAALKGLKLLGRNGAVDP